MSENKAGNYANQLKTSLDIARPGVHKSFTGKGRDGSVKFLDEKQANVEFIKDLIKADTLKFVGSDAKASKPADDSAAKAKAAKEAQDKADKEAAEAKALADKEAQEAKDAQDNADKEAAEAKEAQEAADKEAKEALAAQESSDKADKKAKKNKK